MGVLDKVTPILVTGIPTEPMAALSTSWLDVLTCVFTAILLFRLPCEREIFDFLLETTVSGQHLVVGPEFLVKFAVNVCECQNIEHNDQ
ncbi:hypothetical protein Q1695_012305 [Nippostrongylus brasiliensis]|nr:hypothetical protein Q1695_012305 [Nippostrongylus brasiliensis]